jgi:hypothetical protein
MTNRGDTATAATLARDSVGFGEHLDVDDVVLTALEVGTVTG